MNTQRHSPFFTRRVRSPTASISRTTSSPHFVRSPSSTYGSLQGRSNVMVDVMELPFQRDDKNFEDQFGMCPHFQASDSCQPVSVRHLCRSACYLRAFAPTREWQYLRKAILEYSDESPDHVLRGWACTLAPNRACEGKRPSAKVCFRSPEGKMFNSKMLVLRMLGIIERDVLIRNRVGDNCVAPSGKRKALSENIKYSEMKGNRQQWRPLLKPLKDRRSPLGLIEELFCDDPWRLLLSTILLNRTSRVQLDAVLHRFLSKWPTPHSVVDANWEEISSVIAPLGIRHRRAKGLIRFSRDFLSSVAETSYSLTRGQVLSLYYCGDYACDAYQIFIQGNINVLATDHALQDYIEYQRGAQLQAGD